MGDDDEGEEVPEDDVEDMENMTVGVAFNSTGFTNFLISLSLRRQTKVRPNWSKRSRGS